MINHSLNIHLLECKSILYETKKYGGIMMQMDSDKTNAKNKENVFESNYQLRKMSRFWWIVLFLLTLLIVHHLMAKAISYQLLSILV